MAIRNQETKILASKKPLIGETQYLYLTLTWARTSYSIKDRTSQIEIVATLSSNANINWGTTTYSLSTTYPRYDTTGTVEVNISKDSSIEVLRKTCTWEHPVGGGTTPLFIQFGVVDFQETGWYGIKFQDTLDALPEPVYAEITFAPGTFTNESEPTIRYTNSWGEDVEALEMCIASTDNGSTIYIPYREVSKTGTAYTYTFTEVEKNTLINALGTDTAMDVRFYIRTTIYGERYYHSVVRRFMLRGAKPTLSPTVKDVDATTIALTGDSSKFVRYYSDASFTINAEASVGATINHQECTCGGKSLAAASGTITDVESGTFLFTISDTRDNIAYEVIEATLIPYVKLTCNVGVNVGLDGSTSLNIYGNYFNGTFGAKSNILAVSYRYRESGGSWTSWEEAPIVADANTYSGSPTFTIEGFSQYKSYDFEARAVDRLANISSTVEGLTALPMFDWGQNDFNFNVPIYMNNTQVLRRSDGINATVLSSNGYICLRPEGTTDTTGQVEIKKDALLASGLNLTGLAKAMTRRYELPCEVGAGVNYSSVDCNLYLYGNTIRGYLNCVRKENAGEGDIQNEIVCGVTFDSGGKVTGFGAMSFCSGGKGSPATFSMTETTVYPNDGSVDESQVGKGYFNIYLTGASHADTEWQCFFSFPAIIDLNKF